jgi:phospholipase C
MPAPNPLQNITHVFVLMLENRSFDHMLGFSGITGMDAETRQPTKLRGLQGTEFNVYQQVNYPVKQPADFVMPVDPPHEFPDTVEQLCGPNVTYTPGAPYPPINNSGFVKNYITTKTPHEGHPHDTYGEVMKCYRPSQLPVLNALAKEFAVCDNWFSSMPGPTWPNRFFVHAASSGGLDHTPTTHEIAGWQTAHGFAFQNGTIFNRLNRNWRLYRGDTFITDSFPNVSALKGIEFWDAYPYRNFAKDIAANYSPRYTFIEPSYGNVLNNSYRGGNSQHPLDDVTSGEKLIKDTYETIRKSPIWNSSLLIITWDEHGGFYDHVAPPKAVKAGDATVTPGNMNKYGFSFDQLGVRVPAVIVSPYMAQNVIDHRLYEHASIPATLEKLFGLAPLTKRDAQANNLTSLITLTAPRSAPLTLPNPAASGVPATAIATELGRPAPDDVPVNTGNVPGFLHAALSGDLALSPEEEHPAILARFKKIKTMRDAQNYLLEVQHKAQAASLIKS